MNRKAEIGKDNSTREFVSEREMVFMNASMEDKETIYLKMNSYAEVEWDEIKVKDVAKIYAKNKEMEERISQIRIYEFARDAKIAKQNNEKSKITIGVLWVIRKIEECEPHVQIQNIGITDIVISRLPSLPDNKKKIQNLWYLGKVAFVCMVSFFGSAFTIMAFHNDIGIRKLFQGIYEEIMGRPSSGFTMLEIAYSVGLAAGILLFFNHFGKKKFTQDPTPIEVEMKNYENDICRTLVETASRKGEELE